LSLEHLVSEENRLTLRHGVTWGGSGRSPKNELTESRAEGQVSIESIKSNNVAELARFLTQMAEAMSEQIASRIYQTVSEGADSVGNVVSAREEGSGAAAFLAMLKRIEFGVGSDGKVSLPSIHIAPGGAEKLLKELEAQGPEFRAEVELVKQQKAEAALSREHDRLSKYKA
jgi:hypothetical protein